MFILLFYFKNCKSVKKYIYISKEFEARKNEQLLREKTVTATINAFLPPSLLFFLNERINGKMCSLLFFQTLHNDN